MSAPTVSIGVDYAQTKDEILLFLQKHQHTLEEMAHQSHVLIDMALLPDTLSEQVERNTRTFTQLFYTCLDTLLPPAAAPTDDASPLQVLLHHRKLRNDTQDRQQYPPALTRTYTLGFKPRESLPEISVRQITAESVGKMVRIKGMVTRVSNVKPLAVVAAYHCDKCASEVFQDVAAESWTPLVTCPSEKCRINNTKGKLFMETRGCKFVRFQEMKIQELTDQVPIGHIPRYMTVYLTDDMTRKASPGETIVVSGVILPVPFTGYKAMRAGLITDTYLDAHHIVQTRKQYANMEPTPLLDQAVRDIIEMDGAYDKLASSIAPEIYGHHDVKKALLLMLVGGTSKETGDGMKVRGDINLCLMGDPGVAKSQLLKYISKIAPRAVYTTGRGSSGVGLTASVTRDPVTEEMVLEGGALVLADNGIACIDEFDKMDESDRTAIHEVMEQQTISISKAGITTTLNARTSILAAANPQYGRYNTRMKPTDNINLPAALLSRFDLLFLLLDKPNIQDDLRLAQHVTFVHKSLRHPTNDGDTELIPMSTIKYFISKAREFQPTLPSAVGDYVVNAYVHLRQHASETSEFQYTSARTLLSVVRLGTALARLRFAHLVHESDIDEALRLIETSKSSLLDEKRKTPQDAMSAIFTLVKQMCTRANGTLERQVNISDIKERAKVRGYSDKLVDDCIETYEHDDVWMRAGEGKLRWLRIQDDDEDSESDAEIQTQEVEA